MDTRHAGREIAQLNGRFPGTLDGRKTADILTQALAALGLEPERQALSFCANAFIGQARRRAVAFGVGLWFLIKLAMVIPAVITPLGLQAPLRMRMLAMCAAGLLLVIVELVLLNARRGCNVWARIDPAGKPRREVVLVAHRDSARPNGVEVVCAIGLSLLRWTGRYSTRVAAWSKAADGRFASDRQFRKWAIISVAAIVALATLVFVFRVKKAPVWLMPWSVLAIMWTYELAVSRPWPLFTSESGSNDNASGVAATLAIAENLAQRPLEHIAVTVLFTDGEEVGLRGFKAWLRRYGRSLSSAVYVAIDCVGEGELEVRTPEPPSPEVALLAAKMKHVSRPKILDDVEVSAVEGGARAAIAARTPFGHVHGHWDDGFDGARWDGWQENIDGVRQVVGDWLEAMDGVQ